MRPIGLIAFIFAFCVAAPSFAQDAKQIEAAKKDGKLVVYGTMQSDIFELLQKAFFKKTGIAVDYWRTSATKVMERALSEARAGKALFDLVMTTEDTMRIMLKEGILAKYDSPMNRDFPKDAIDPDLGPRARNHIVGIVYNKNSINPADAPKTLEDLIKPQYRGKLVMADPTLHTTTAQWLVNLHKLIGKEKADKFVRDLAAMKPTLVESFGPAAERVTSGEIPIAISYVYYVYLNGLKGAPLDYVRTGKFLGDASYLTLFHKAPHPNAAKAFIDFFLDEESMTSMAKAGEFVNRKGVYPPVPDADKIQFVEMDDLGEKLYAEKRKEFQKLFLR
ncbi:MAG TPA: extracellular solute-binding protein [Candidatus Saccharimonadales bacterium]|nr:extracellular solute-binding protein [Candidatus Saccharimonadales bacterium]